MYLLLLQNKVNLHGNILWWNIKIRKVDKKGRKQKIQKKITYVKNVKKMNFLLIAILASNVYGLLADADTDYNHVNSDGSYAFGLVFLTLLLRFRF